MPPTKRPAGELTTAQVETLPPVGGRGRPVAEALGVPPAGAGPMPPAASDPEWARNPIDRFILARLEQTGLSPSPEADRVTLIRRMTLDLTGLPPTPAEVDAFLDDRSPDAVERLVDRLLASPRYGERMAWRLARRRPLRRHERLPDATASATCGAGATGSSTAYNRNMPFDQFTVEQLAGDLLPRPTLTSGSPPGSTATTAATPRAASSRRSTPSSTSPTGSRRRHRLARPDARLLPLPRPQVRPVHPEASSTGCSPTSTTSRRRAGR